MKGRPRKPSALKALQGNAGHRSDDGLREITMPSGIPEPPEHMSPGAKQEFFRVAKFLGQVHGLLSPTDHAALGIYCSYYDQWQQAEAQIPVLRERVAQLEDELDTRRLTKARRVVMEKRAGRARNELNLALGERNKGRREMRAYLTELGLSPGARTRLRTPDGQQELPGLDTEDPLAAARRQLGA